MSRVLLRGARVITMAPHRPDAERADVLSAARIALAAQRGHDHERHRQDTGSFALTATITAKQALAWATTEGARALGLADRVGRLEAVMVAVRRRKRDHALVDVDPGRVRSPLHESAEHLLAS
ncbi:amidohydrolase family protein [Amycolatopsis sp. NPDC004169]|uniref:amidohydrolase family protein n=1 Tax=Amycolatopsis sp. NPDC004169 TaxID=3154453 RepID=UPI0033BE4331